MKRVAFSLTAVSLLLSGCATTIGVKQDIDADGRRIQSTLDTSLQKMPVNQGADKLLYTTILPGSWLGTAKKVQRPGNALPAAFYSTVTLKFPDTPNLSTFAERLTKVTGIPVKLRPDVYISASAFAPKSGGGAASTPPGAPTGAAANAAAAAAAAQAASLNNGPLLAATTSSDYNSEIPLNYTGRLEGFLDAVTARTGLNWEYKDGAIVLSRLVTKTFTLKSTPGTSELRAAVGKTGGSSVGTGSSFSADSSIKMGSSFSVWDNLRDSINTMLTGVGKVAVTEATGTITVTDTKDVVDQVGAMLQQINKSLSRQVAFRVEVLSLTTTDTAEYGVDWNAIFAQVRGLNPSWTMGLTSPSSLVGPDAGKLGYQVLTPAESGGTRGKLTGSQAMLSAMAGYGKASVVTTASAMTLNRQPVPVAITDQISYVQSVAVQPSTTGSNDNNSTVAITPGTVTTGFILNMLPSITDDNGVILQFSVDISMLSKMGTFGSGAMAVQTPEVAGMQFLQRVAMKNGETLVLSGFERTSGQYDRRTMSKDSDLLMGGSLNGNRTKESIVILITPVLSEGA